MIFFPASFETITGLPEIFGYFFVAASGAGRRKFFERRHSPRSERAVNRFSELRLPEM